MSTIYLMYIVAIVLVCVSCFWAFRHKKLSDKRTLFFAMTGVVCITLLCILFPFSNLWVQYPSPYAAYSATQTGDEAIVIEGHNSALVVAVGKSGSAYHTSIIPKGENGWKIPGALYMRTITRRLFPDLVLHVYHARNTGDYYVSIYAIGTDVRISDSQNSTFKMLNTNDSSKGAIYAYYAWVEDLPETYWITVNGETLLP